MDICEKRLASWKRNCLSKGGRFTLIKSTLSNLPIYYLSTLMILVKVIRRIVVIQCQFLQGDEGGRRRYHLVK